MNIKSGNYTSTEVVEEVLFNQIQRELASRIEAGQQIKVETKSEFGTPFENDTSENTYILKDETQIIELLNNMYHCDFTYEIQVNDKQITVNATGRGLSVHVSEVVTFHIGETKEVA